MWDIAALDDNGDWLVRALKDPEVDALKEVAHGLSRVISPVVVLPPDSSQMNFIGEAARRWDLNIDLFVRELIEYGILFVQPHSLEKLEYDNNKYAFATAHNTEVIMEILVGFLVFQTLTPSCVDIDLNVGNLPTAQYATLDIRCRIIRKSRQRS